MARMEHRCGARHPLDAQVFLRPQHFDAVRGCIREASISGMFVNVEPELFCENSVIDVEVTLPGVASLRTYHWQAMVVRRTDSGLGLMFDHLRPPAISRLLAGLEHETGYGPERASPQPRRDDATASRESMSTGQPQA